MEEKELKFDKISSYLLGAWISLPLLMVLCHFVQGVRGNFPTKEEIIDSGMTYGYVTYTYTTSTYQTFFYVLGVITILFLLIFSIMKKKKVFSLEALANKQWLFYLFYLLCWAILCTALSDSISYAFVGESYLRDGLSSYFVYAGVFALAYSIQNEKYKMNLIRYFVGVISFLSILMLIHSTHVIAFFDYIFPTKFAVIFNQFNHYGYVLCMCCLACFGLLLYDTGNKRNTVLYAASFVLNYIALLINDTFGSWIATIVAIVIIYILYLASGRKELDTKVFFVLYAVLLIASILFSPTLMGNIATLGNDVSDISSNSESASTAGTGRWTLWKDTVQRILKRPIFGYGPEGLYGDNAITNGDSPHNEYLQIAAFMGIPGLILYLAALFTFFKNRISKLKELSPVILVAAGVTGGYLISAFFGNPVFNTYPFYMMFFGLASSYGFDTLYKDKK